MKPEDIIERLTPIKVLIDNILKELLIGQTGSLLKIQRQLNNWITRASEHIDDTTELNERTLQQFENETHLSILKHLNAAAYYYQLEWRSTRPDDTLLDTQYVNTQWQSFVTNITPQITPSPLSVIIDYDELSQLKHPSLNFQLRKLKAFFEGTPQRDHNNLACKQLFFKKPPADDIALKDVLDYQTQYQAITDKANRIIKATQDQLREIVNRNLSDEQLFTLGRTLCQAIQQVQACNTERETIIKNIDAIYPATEDEQILCELERKKLDLLNEKLQAFLDSLTPINVQASKDDDMSFLTERLKAFVNSFHDLITQKYPMGDERTSTILQALQSHLAEEESLSATKTPSFFHRLMSKVKNSAKAKKEPIKKAPTLNEKIAQVHYALKELDAFPMQAIANCFKINANNKAVRNQLEQLQSTIAQHLSNINTQLKLISFGSDSHQKMNELKNKLLELKTEIPQLEATVKSLPKLETLEQVTQLQQLTQTTLEEQEKLQSELQGIEKSIENTGNEVTSSLSHLKGFYQQQKQSYQNKLNQAIDDAEAALVFDSGAFKPTDIITKTLQPSRDFAHAILERQDSLVTIQTDTQTHISTLTKRIELIKDKLREKITPHFNKIKESTFPLEEVIKQELSEINPFRDDVLEIAKITQEYLFNYQSHINTLEQTSGSGLQRWNDSYNQQKSQIERQIEGRDLLSQSAGEIERRLKTNGYKTSITLLTQLKEEYVRIFDKYIDSRRTKKLKQHQKTELKQQREHFINDYASLNHLEQQATINTLNSIDPRLIKLIQIYADFKAINREYIGKDARNPKQPFPLNDKSYCERLKGKVEEHLRCPKMEAMSDGVHSKFFQWIRKHLLKPLQNLMHKKSNPHHFFTTGACKTEKALVRLGNEQYRQLTAGT